MSTLLARLRAWLRAQADEWRDWIEARRDEDTGRS